QFAEIKSALLRYKMIYFRGQDISLDDQERFTLRFGEFGTDAYTQGVPGHPNVQRLIKEADTVTHWVFGEGWHSDSPFLPRPPAISLLWGKDIPPFGGDTWWSNTELAWRFLSPTMQRLLDGLRTHRSAARVLRQVLKGAGSYHFGDMNLTVDQQKMVEGSYHPLVRRHPDTGEKALYVDWAYSLGIEGMTEEEAQPLLDFLTRHVTNPLFCCRLRWEKHTFVLWDNRSCIHQAFNDYD